MTEIYHVNFHTVRRVPIFLDEGYAASLMEIVSAVLAEHEIIWNAWTVMPTHVHVVVTTFPDQTRANVVQLLKGSSARLFLKQYPLLGEELGGHLWQQGYDWVFIENHRQFVEAVRYVNDNRSKIGLGPVGDH